jgi:hypothetical protein
VRKRFNSLFVVYLGQIMFIAWNYMVMNNNKLKTIWNETVVAYRKPSRNLLEELWNIKTVSQDSLSRAEHKAETLYCVWREVA